MIIDVEKYIFYGFRNDLNRFFDLAQEKGIIEFIHPKKKYSQLPEVVTNLQKSIKILKKQPVTEQAKNPPEWNGQTLSERILSLEQSLHSLEDEKRALYVEIERVKIFGDFQLRDLKEIEEDAHRFMQFFCIKTSKREEIKLPPELVFVGRDFELDYFVTLLKEKRQFQHMIEIQIERPLGELKARLEFVQSEIEIYSRELKNLACYLEFLNKELIQTLNHYYLHATKNYVKFDVQDQLFMIEAWIPENKIQEARSLIQSLNVDMQPIRTEKKDRVPTYMENKGTAKIGEDLVHIYDTPDPSDKDPSLWVFICFSIFFAMIVADAGYGAIYLLLALFLKWRFPNPKPMLKRFFKLVLVLGVSCTLWGTAMASFFGMEIGPNNPLRKVSFIHFLAQKKAEYHVEKNDAIAQEWHTRFPETQSATNGHDFLVKASKEVFGKKKYFALDEFYDNILMELSLLVGVIHIAFSFLRNLRRNWASIGWIAFMIGGYLFFPSILKATSILNFMGWISKSPAYYWGEYLLYGGFISAVVLALIQRGLSAIEEATLSIQIFADILSYLRLYALALASMIMASTFNGIAEKLGMFIGIFVILVGHSVNIVMGIMGGIIHGLRLNFLEWYHYSFEGGGKPFDPLRIRK